jgi:2-methylisocitrate lyase-like PEP mutase family enzyme
LSPTPSQVLRRRITENSGPLILPGANNALTARVIEEAGFEAVYLSGAGIANTYLGVPDVGLVTANELIGHVEAVRNAVDIPIVVDADTGFGNAMNVMRTVKALTRAGADAIQLEDQISPKRCGHFAGKEVISSSEMVGKIHAATDSRLDDSVVIIARTDARATHGLEAACERGQLYLEHGADVAFIEAPRDLDELAAIGSRVKGPLLANMVEGGLTPILPATKLYELGFSIVLYANSAMRASVVAMQDTMSHLLRAGDTVGIFDRLLSWDDRQALVKKPYYDSLEELYKG